MERHPIDEMSDWELFREFNGVFGVRRSTELMGFAVLWGITGVVNDLSAYRKRLEEQGISERAVFRALADFRRFREHIEQRAGMPTDVPQVISRLSRLGVTAS